jgi:REP element-mobilizing transposase RayT
MIHAYHVIWGTYGFWLPNDPRGSWTEFVAAWELVHFGKSTYSFERSDIDVEKWRLWRDEARGALRYPPVTLTGEQAQAVGNGLQAGVRKSNLEIWACSIMPEHIHLVVGRHTYKVEQICNLLKGEGTKALKAKSLHPQAGAMRADGKLPSCWAEGQWKVYLDTEEAIENAIRYVEQNPIKEGKAAQRWSFVTPFSGLPKGWTTYH